MTSDPVRQSLVMLRHNHGAVLASDERIDGCSYVLDGETGRPVACVPKAALLADEHVLFIPDESPGSLQLLTIPEALEGSERCCDQWRVYFGKSRGGAFVRFAIDCARVAGDVLDGDELMHRNDLLTDVAALCGHFNRRAGVMELLCTKVRCASPKPALLVGVDGYGFDVKTKFSVLRFRFGSRASDRDDAAARIELMIKDAKGST